jgi:glycosyltransferase involved in cell wall biosynthesis
MKILIVCESVHGNESGGRVVRYLAKILHQKGHQLKLVVLKEKYLDSAKDSFIQDSDIVFYPLKVRLFNRLTNIFFETNEIKKFRSIINSFLPDVVHFASFDNLKPFRFIIESKKTGAKVILQPWTMQFFCAQGFGYRNNQICTLCSNRNYFNAFYKQCITYRGIPSQLERYYLHKWALVADVFLSSNSDLDKILYQYGVKKEKIVRFPIPFDYTFLNQIQKSEKDYFIFYGQLNSHKGLQVLLKAFSNLPNQKLKIYPLSRFPEDIIRTYNIEIINDINWSNGLAEAIANSKAVLIPSLWSTSTEYSLCEALLLKKPVVLFNVGVHKHIFKNRINAMVVEPNEIESFVKAIIELDQNEELRSTIGVNGYKTLLEINNQDKIYSQLINAYTLKPEK